METRINITHDGRHYEVAVNYHADTETVDLAVTRYDYFAGTPTPATIDERVIDLADEKVYDANDWAQRELDQMERAININIENAAEQLSTTERAKFYRWVTNERTEARGMDYGHPAQQSATELLVDYWTAQRENTEGRIPAAALDDAELD